MNYLELFGISLLALSVIGGPLIYFYFWVPLNIGKLFAGRGAWAYAIGVSLLVSLLPLIFLAVILWIGLKLSYRFISAISVHVPIAAAAIFILPLYVFSGFISAVMLYFQDTPYVITQVHDIRLTPDSSRYMYEISWERLYKLYLPGQEVNEIKRGKGFYVDRNIVVKKGDDIEGMIQILKEKLPGLRFRHAVLFGIIPEDFVRFYRQLTQLKAFEDPFPLDIRVMWDKPPCPPNRPRCNDPFSFNQTGF